MVKFILLFLISSSLGQWNILDPNSPSRIETGPLAQITPSMGSSMWCMNSDDMYVLTNDNQMWKFEKEDKRWLWQPNLPTTMSPRSDAAYWKMRGKFYVYGGIYSDQSLDDMWTYDLTLRDFVLETAIASSPGPCYGTTFWTHEPSNRLYLWGGMCKNVTNDKVYSYDTTLRVWNIANVGSAGPEGSLYGAVVMSGSLAYIYTNDQLWSFDMQTGRWTIIPAAIMPFGPNRTRMALWSTIDGENLMMYGGQSGSKMFGDTWSYTLATNSWRIKSTDGPIPRTGMSYCIDSNGYMNMFGGNDGLYVLNDLWQYGPFTVKTVVDMVQWKLDSATIMATWAAAASTILLGLFCVLLIGFCARKCMQKKSEKYPLGNLNTKPLYVEDDI